MVVVDLGVQREGWGVRCHLRSCRLADSGLSSLAAEAVEPPVSGGASVPRSRMVNSLFNLPGRLRSLSLLLGDFGMSLAAARRRALRRGLGTPAQEGCCLEVPGLSKECLPGRGAETMGQQTAQSKQSRARAWSGGWQGRISLQDRERRSGICRV